MLDQIPPEIISSIAKHLCLSQSTTSSSSLASIPPLSLLLTCKTIYEAIAPIHNPRLYSDLFKFYFDVDAAERRLGHSHNRSSAQKKNTNTKLRVQDLCSEFEKRSRSLFRLGRQVNSGDLNNVRQDDLWVIYLMLIENDGKNIQHLLAPGAVLDLVKFLVMYHEQHFLAAAIEPGYPAETVGRSLAMWIAWLVGGSGPADESAEEREERMFVLRPYVFAAQQYEVYFAPWVLPDLPLTRSSNPTDDPNSIQHDPFVADLAPKTRSLTMQMYGNQISLSPPILAHAAILRFFFKKPGEDWDESENNSTGVATPFEMINQNGANNNSNNAHNPLPLAQLPVVLNVINNNNGDDEAIVDSNSLIIDAPTSTTPNTRYPLISSSLAHDRDFDRLRACYDPYSSRGMRRSAWRGSWDGCWEGTFSFFDFDAFRTMLAGNARALYEGPYGEQAQVWRIKETYVRRQGYRRRSEPQADTNGDAEDDDEEVDLEKEVDGESEMDVDGEGSQEQSISEGSDEQSKDLLSEKFKALRRGQKSNFKKSKGKSGLPLSGPMINAGFPTTSRPSVYASLSTAAAEAETLKETIKQQVDAIEGYEVVPEDELDEMFDEEDGGEAAGLELLLSGTGHSAWGKFILKGRVRAWDGMASLVKEYAPDSRGKWIYRGYVVSGDIFVGRWRDTFTPEAYVGYEGTFILNRR